MSISSDPLSALPIAAATSSETQSKKRPPKKRRQTALSDWQNAPEPR